MPVTVVSMLYRFNLLIFPVPTGEDTGLALLRKTILRPGTLVRIGILHFVTLRPMKQFKWLLIVSLLTSVVFTFTATVLTIRSCVAPGPRTCFVVYIVSTCWI